MSEGLKFDTGKPEMAFLGRTDTWWHEDKNNVQYHISLLLDLFWFDNEEDAPLMALKAIRLEFKEYLPAVMEVLKFGANKYGLHNYRLGMDWSRLVGAARRHLYYYPLVMGEVFDTETKVNHIFNAYCCLQFLYEYSRDGLGTDDRFKKKEVPSPIGCIPAGTVVGVPDNYDYKTSISEDQVNLDLSRGVK